MPRKDQHKNSATAEERIKKQEEPLTDDQIKWQIRIMLGIVITLIIVVGSVVIFL